MRPKKEAVVSLRELVRFIRVYGHDVDICTCGNPKLTAKLYCESCTAQID